MVVSFYDMLVGVSSNTPRLSSPPLPSKFNYVFYFEIIESIFFDKKSKFNWILWWKEKIIVRVTNGHAYGCLCHDLLSVLPKYILILISNNLIIATKKIKKIGLDFSWKVGTISCFFLTRPIIVIHCLGTSKAWCFPILNPKINLLWHQGIFVEI